MRELCLREVLDLVRPGAEPHEVSPILAKLAKRDLVVKGERHNGRRMVNTFRWRTVLDGR